MHTLLSYEISVTKTAVNNNLLLI